MDLLNDILKTQKLAREDKIKTFQTMFSEEPVAVKQANIKAQQVQELEDLKDKQEKELESLKDKHERSNEKLGLEKEKESENSAIQKQRDADRKANESVDLEEGKYVSGIFDIINVITKKVADRLEKEYSRNPEKGLGMINTIGAMIGHKVTDQKQEKGKLFLKFGEETVTEDRELDALKRKFKRDIKKYENDGYFKNSKANQAFMDYALDNGEIKTDDPDEFEDWMDRDVLESLETVDEVEESYAKDKAKRLKDILKKHDKRMMKSAKDSIKKYEKGRKEETEVEEDRDYKKEYENYHSDPEQIKRRAKRNEARRSLKNSKKLTSDKDVHHKDNNPMNNDKSNLSIVTQNYNRKEPRMRDKLKEKGCLPNAKRK